VAAGDLALAPGLGGSDATVLRLLLYVGHPEQAVAPPVPSHLPSPGHVPPPVWVVGSDFGAGAADGLLVGDARVGVEGVCESTLPVFFPIATCGNLLEASEVVVLCICAGKFPAPVCVVG
jgi:hypothetical protein